MPVDFTSQRRLEQGREAALVNGVPPVDVRAVVRDSWQRALRAQVQPQLSHAPVVWDEDALHAGRERADWLPLSRRALAAQNSLHAAGGQVLTLFDASGRMLLSQGEPGALDALAGIGFHPGALWAEHAVGTNGPGTALVTGGPVHIVGAEHFCEAWQPWHCAAVPIRDPASGDIVGVVDISGPRESAHPYALTLSLAVAMTIEQMLATREAERRVRVLSRLAELAGRWPGDIVIAVDRRGLVLGSSAGPGATIPGVTTEPERLQRLLAETLATGGAACGEVRLPGGTPATLLPVFDGTFAIGACLVVSAGTAARCYSTARLAGRPVDAAPPVRGRPDGHSARYSLADLVGQSSSLVDACRIAFAAAGNTLPVLLHGESGTGKEVFAQGIHQAGGRAAGPFVAVNCAALPRELIESELFGYVGGAFSGARREGAAGRFEVADGGTIFLDEVTELSTAAQAALLRVLQEGEVTRVGASRARRVDVRVIAASNRDLAACLAEGSLREDLFYRLSVLAIELPPLRSRPEDIVRLAEHFLAEAGRELGRPQCRFGPGVLDALGAYSWPGNVRELRNLLRRLVALAAGAEITCADLPLPIREAPWSRAPDPSRPPALPPVPRPAGVAADDGDDRAREELRLVIEHASSMQEAAARLGIARSTLYRRLERYGLRAGRTVRS